MTRAVFFDVDGTLLSHAQNAVPAGTRRALEQLRERGIQRVIATGRHPLELAMLPVKDIDFDGYITLNGQLCLDGRKNVIFGNPITGPDREQLILLFEEKSVPMVLVEKEAMYINFVNRHVEIAQRAISTEIPEIGTYTGNEIYQAIAYLEKEREEAVFRHLSGCKVTRWNAYAVDIISREGGKASGIQAYLTWRCIRREETAAFGDGENDIEMLEYVQTGIAMGNADRAVAEAADVITAPVDDNGIEKALIRLGIID